jgi:hypothetical protein
MTPHLLHAFAAKPAAKLAFLAGSACAGILAIRIAACSAANQATIAKDEALIEQDTDLVCDYAEPVANVVPLPDAGAWVTFACTSLEAVEGLAVAITSMTVRVPASQAATFAAKHASVKRIVTEAGAADAGSKAADAARGG